jgi:tetratricopeptide (TPR) repeat protein
MLLDAFRSRWLGAVAIALCTAAAQSGAEAPIPDSKRDAGAFFASGFELLNQGQPDAAVIQFERGLLIQPDDYKAHYLLGEAYLKTGNNGKALEHFNRTIDLAPKVSKESALAETRAAAIAKVLHAETALQEAKKAQPGVECSEKLRKLPAEQIERLIPTSRTQLRLGRYDLGSGRVETYPCGANFVIANWDNGRERIKTILLVGFPGSLYYARGGDVHSAVEVMEDDPTSFRVQNEVIDAEKHLGSETETCRLARRDQSLGAEMQIFSCDNVIKLSYSPTPVSSSAELYFFPDLGFSTYFKPSRLIRLSGPVAPE